MRKRLCTLDVLALGFHLFGDQLLVLIKSNGNLLVSMLARIYLKLHALLEAVKFLVQYRPSLLLLLVYLGVFVHHLVNLPHVLSVLSVSSVPHLCNGVLKIIF